MTASKVEVVVLHCDQGMGTMVKVFEEVMGSEELTYLALIDLGSETSTKRYATDAVDEVMNTLQAMTPPRIDLLVLSHQDNDHWSLMPELKDRIVKAGLNVELGAFFRGGARWKKRALDNVRSYEQHFGVDSEPLPRSHSDYENPAKLGKLDEHAGAVFRVLAVNTPVARSADDLIRNGTSAVIVVEFAGNHAVLPGDATADTIAFVNEIFREWKRVLRRNPVTPCFLVGAPHHGALRTLASNFTTKAPKLDVAKEFADALKARWVAASAGYESDFYHPFLGVMRLLSVGTGKEATTHTFVVWNEAKNRWEAVEDTDQNIFTTICSLTNPPLRQSWSFEMAASGELSVSFVSRGGQPQAAQVRRVGARSR